MDDFLMQFRDKFIEDATDLINKLETDLLDLEENPQSGEHIESVFRAMHTLKGVSAMYGFENIQDLTHKMENIYDFARSGELLLETEHLDLTLKAVDFIKELLQASIDEQEGKNDALEIFIKDIDSLLKSNEGSSKNKKNAGKKTVVHGPHDASTFYVLFKQEENLHTRGIKLVNIFRDLAELGRFEIVEHSPISKTSKQGYTEWGIYVVTNKDKEAIEDAFMFVSDNILIRQIAPFNLFNEEEFNKQFDKIHKIRESEKKADIQQSILHMVNKKYQHKTTEKEVAETKPAGKKEVVPKTDPIEETVKPEVNNPPDESPIADTPIKIETSKRNRISIESSKLDTLMYLVTELVTMQSQLGKGVEEFDEELLNKVYEKMQKLTKQFRDNALNLRLIPVSDLVVRIKRLIRDLSKQLGKDVEFITQGIDTELDKNTIDVLAEPLMHIIRNCLDHGIESPAQRKKNNKAEKGLIKFTAYHSGNYVFIQVQDDGRGIDPEKIRKKAIEKGIVAPDKKLTESEIFNLIFLPGFSTAQNLTEVSGRGVGMDVVKKRINEIRGEVDVNSEINLGTSFTIKLQQTIAIIDTMLVKSEYTNFLIPLSDIEVCSQVKTTELDKRDSNVLSYNNKMLPYVSLREVFNMGNNKPEIQKFMVINKQEKRLVLMVDTIIGEHQAVLKPLGDAFKEQRLITSASQLGDGSLALLVDINALFGELATN